MAGAGMSVGFVAEWCMAVPKRPNFGFMSREYS